MLSSQILDEYQRVANILSSRFPLIDISPIIDLVIIHGQFIDTQGCDISICEDPDDNKFLECAVAGACNTIVSGDKHLLKVSGYRDLAVLTPRQFLAQHLSSD